MKLRFQIRLDSLDQAAKFCGVCAKFQEDIDYEESHRVMVDAKSLQGVIATGIGKKMIVDFHSYDDDTCQKFAKEINKEVFN